jgi:flagellar hook-length control protein FliK
LALPAATTPNAVAVVIPVALASTGVPASAVGTSTANAEGTPAASVALAEVVAATAPAPKTAILQTPVAALPQARTSASSESAAGSPDPSTTGVPTVTSHNSAAQQAALTGKQDASILDPAKADAPNSPPALNASTHEHATTADAGQTLTNLSDPGLQAAGTIQPQLAAPVAAPAAALTVTAATGGAVPFNGLGLEIAVSAQSGKSHFEIRLDPADLGRIDVRIDVDSNGQMTSHLTVEKPETLSMLRQDAPQLQRALDDAGFKTGNDGLQFSLRDQSSSGQNNGNESGRNAQRLVISDETTLPASVAGRTYGRMLGSSSGVDIRV